MDNGVIKSADNKTVKYAVHIKTSAKFRRNEGLFFAEGLRLILDAVKNGQNIKVLFLSQDTDSNPDIENMKKASEKVITVTAELMKKLCDTVTPQGIAALISIPKEKKIPKDFSLLIALERTQDPQNIGAIARSAEAFGADGIIISADSCDPYAPKSLRAGMGAMLRIPVYRVSDFVGTLQEMKKFGTEVISSVVSGEKEDIRNLSPRPLRVLVIGNEGSGVSETTREISDKCVTIPMFGRAESLNASAAAAVLIWECVRGNGYDTY